MDAPPVGGEGKMSWSAEGERKYVLIRGLNLM
jgi:hypothetical protein